MRNFWRPTWILLALLAIASTALADYWVTASDTARGPIRLGQDVDWSSGDTKIVSEEVIGFYNAHTDVFTVTEVTATGAEVNGLTASSAGGMTTDLVALAAGGQTGATALSLGMNNVITSATAGDSVKLPTAATGNVVRVKNSGATAIDIFPFLADKIDALAANLAVTLHPGGVAQFHALDAITWESDIDNSISLNGPTTAKGGLRILAADNTTDTDVTLTNAAHGQATVVTVPDVGLATSYVVQSTAALTAAEANYLDLTALGTGAASKAVVLDAGEDYVWPATGILTYGVLKDPAATTITATGAELNYNDASVNEALMTMGTGADGMDAYGYGVDTIGGIKITRILVDIDGLNAGGTADDIIGEDGGVANANLGQITAAVNGTIYAGTVECMEIATGGDTAISVTVADNETGAEDAAKSGLTNGVEVLAGLDCSGLNSGVITLPLAADKYIYLTGDTGGDATYTAGVLLITLYGL